MTDAKARYRAITINGRFLSQPITGVQRYAYEVLNAIDSLLSTGQIESIPVTVLAPKNANIVPSWKSLCLRRLGNFTGQLWEQIDLAIHARGTLLFTPCGGAPLLHDRHVITIHDAGPFSTPHAYSATYRAYYKVLQRLLAKRAAHILTVSEFSKGELVRVLRVPETKISSIWLSGEHILRVNRDDSVIERNHLSPGKYVLGVGSRNPNKNLTGLVQAFAYLENEGVTLAIAGGSNAAVFGKTKGSGGAVRELGFVSDEELRSLYENAACFVFPSIYEGFGFPPLEALSLGTPVVVARAASMPEIFGDSVLYCDPHSPQDIAEQVRRAINNVCPSRDAAIEYAAQFTWEQCARRTWPILQNTLSL